MAPNIPRKISHNQRIIQNTQRMWVYCKYNALYAYSKHNSAHLKFGNLNVGHKRTFTARMLKFFKPNILGKVPKWPNYL